MPSSRFCSTVPRTALNFKQFLLHQDALKLYRDALHAIKKIPDENLRRGLFNATRTSFRDNMNNTDDMNIETLLKEGRRKLELERDKYEIEPTLEEKFLREKKARERYNRCMYVKADRERKNIKNSFD